MKYLLVPVGLSLTVPTARAGQVLTGDVIEIYYNDYGTWNDTDEGYGFRYYDAGEGDFLDLTYP
ncbi:MAG: hypothetical protein QGG40_14395, partial [Myxococcota bacterium]|nr:hypothetical protein [Myxococcota bacterium]